MTEARNKILWVDDEIELLRSHMLFLEERGYTVLPVTNADDAISLVQQEHFDLVLLDEMLSSTEGFKDGLCALAEIKAINPSLPVVMVTKNEEEALMDQAIGGHIDDYLTKPVNPSQVLATCKQFLDARQIARTPRVFISYARADIEFCTRLAEDLGTAEANIWWDQVDIPPGDRWDESTQKALEGCKFLLVILSPASVDSNNVMDEVTFGLDHQKHVVPVLYRNCKIPFRLTRIQYIDFRIDYDNGLKQLLQTLMLEAKLSSSNDESIDTEKSRRSRTEYNETLNQYIKKYKRLLAVHKVGQNLIDPAVPLPDGSLFIDCICSAFAINGERVLLLPSRDSSPNIEGVGRTSILLRLLGLTIPYGRVIGLGIDEPESPERIPMHFSSTPWCRLLATDMAYIGTTRDELTIVPTRGEMASFVWDLARHIYRSTDPKYKSGDHRKNRKKLLKIFHNIPMTSAIVKLFGELNALHSVDKVIILKRRIQAKPSPPVPRLVTGQKRLNQLRHSMTINTEHGSRFWHREDSLLVKRVDQILNALNEDSLPPFLEITYSHPSPVIPQNTFSEIRDILTEEPPAPLRKAKETLKSGTGIRFHNDILMRCIGDIDQIRFLVTTGEKFFKDVAFWNSLVKRTSEIKIEVLMLNPDSPVVENRQQATYHDKPTGFLKTEIVQNVATLRRMSLYFANLRKRQKPIVSIRCGIYDDLPSFRMTFIGKNRLLVSSYDEGRRTGEQTLFYDINTRHEGTLFLGFNNIYRKLAANAKWIFPN